MAGYFYRHPGCETQAVLVTGKTEGVTQGKYVHFEIRIQAMQQIQRGMHAGRFVAMRPRGDEYRRLAVTPAAGR